MSTWENHLASLSPGYCRANASSPGPVCYRPVGVREQAIFLGLGPVQLLLHLLLLTLDEPLLHRVDPLVPAEVHAAQHQPETHSSCQRRCSWIYTRSRQSAHEGETTVGSTLAGLRTSSDLFAMFLAFSLDVILDSLTSCWRMLLWSSRNWFSASNCPSRSSTVHDTSPCSQPRPPFSAPSTPTRSGSALLTDLGRWGLEERAARRHHLHHELRGELLRWRRAGVLEVGEEREVDDDAAGLEVEHKQAVVRTRQRVRHRGPERVPPRLAAQLARSAPDTACGAEHGREGAVSPPSSPAWPPPHGRVRVRLPARAPNTLRQPRLHTARAAKRTPALTWTVCRIMRTCPDPDPPAAPCPPAAPAAAPPPTAWVSTFTSVALDGVRTSVTIDSWPSCPMSRLFEFGFVTGKVPACALPENWLTGSFTCPITSSWRHHTLLSEAASRRQCGGHRGVYLGHAVPVHELVAQPAASVPSIAPCACGQPVPSSRCSGSRR
eukprot:2564839-Rhodomonas_salina.1